MFRVGADEVEALEKLMDDLQKDLEPLSSFILPGGGKVSAFLHQARTVCRRAEREVEYLWERGLRSHRRRDEKKK
jgi:cob(I)alamin adenosyltransferase